MKNSKLISISTGHRNTKCNSAHTPKKGKGASARKDRKNWKIESKKGWE